MEREGTDVRRIGPTTATLLVVASMVGTGVFTTTGFLLADVGSAGAVLVAWLVGGVFALCGALVYGELAAAIPANGGEYLLLARIFHPAVGFAAGWVSLVVGFSASIAAAALAFGEYLADAAPGVPPVWAGAGLVATMTALHATSVRGGSGAQNALTVMKVVLVGALIVVGLALGDLGRLAPDDGVGLGEAMARPGFAVGLIFVSFAYAGWNGAAYLAGELRDPARTLPLALLGGTALVTALYLGLNAAFLAAAPPEALAGRVDVAHVAATHLLGAGAGRLLSATIALGLLSAVGAMIMSGARVYQAMGRDYARLSVLAYRTPSGAPVAAVVLQSSVALVMLGTSSFGALLTYVGVTVSVMGGVTVLGVFVLRWREPELEEPYRTWGYPVTPGVFVGLAIWMATYGLYARPVAAGAGLATIAVGLALYAIVARGGPAPGPAPSDPTRPDPR